MNARKLMHLVCQDCEKPFDDVCFPHRPYRYCPSCRVKRNTESKYKTTGACHLPGGGKSPFTVVRHDGDDGFPAGSHFPGNQMMLMVKAKHVEGIVVETCGKTFRAEKGKLVPV